MNVNDATWRWMTDEEYAAVRGGVLQHVSREELCGLDDRGTVDLALRDPRLHEEQGLTLSELCSYIARAAGRGVAGTGPAGAGVRPSRAVCGGRIVGQPPWLGRLFDLRR